MTNVAAFRVSDWDKDGTIVKVTTVTLDDGREVPGYDLPPGIEANKPLPDGWEIATSAKGKPYIKVPKAGKGGGGGFAAAFRNTKEGQAIEQERMDRRTALMQAVAVVHDDAMPNWWETADQMYIWLRQTSGSPNPSQGRAGSGGAAAPTQPLSGGQPPTTSPDREGQGRAQNRTSPSGKAAASAPELELTGEGSTSSGTVCVHTDTSPLKPDGSALPAGKLRCLACNTVVKA